ncbi:helix-turn-helix domain-containing protein [Thalassospira sp. MCCC 1A03138]|uniref:AraC family transcriptional regulator n=1 Tax=Thalassospira sp. MCCC 1A03138 TaxID=1470576 RepID=UPI000A1F3697|nr:helix-turn-helix domain-containing protein [Thalassospira sp. MCCC 1A03138]OSQ30588.1 AraC family transcriptional regulator [Thalassospira sp. MCCC 1A03138]
MDTSEIVLLLIAAVGLAQAAFLMLLLRHEGKRAFRANRWLLVFSLTACASFVEDISDVFLSPLYILYLAIIFVPVTFAFLPSIYLYFCEIADRPVRYPGGHFVILVPVAILTAVAVHIMRTRILPGDIGGEIDFELDTDIESHLPVAVILLTIIIALYVQLFGYMVKIWRVAIGYLRQASEQLGADQRVLRRWVTELLTGISLIFLIFTATTIVDVFITDSEWLTTLVQGAFALVFFRMCHVIAHNPALFVQAEWDGAQEMAMDEDARDFTATGSRQNRFAPRNLVDADEISRICKRLDAIRTRSDLLFDPLISLPKLANAVGATSNQLSYVLNQHLGKSFFDFINEVRTGEASRLLVNEPDRTILDIATSVGFNSKSTFNLAFKKITGKTPSVYRSETMSQRNTAP